ncbi:MAG: T9SS type A sorting domain-containing protein, partial [Melioribacteraceae bacterium]|nr:T9SS type A sorting domain-containing protein [Melioribacteraceae bacterium]
DDPFTEPPVLEELRAQGLWGDPGTFNLATSKAHALLKFVDEIGTGVYDQNGNLLPASFSLDQNFPNPFNPSTTIRFHVSEVTPVTLKVYDALGQLVKVLINNQTMSRGTHIVNWNANNLSSGAYFYSLEAAGNVVTKKMMLVK